MLEIQTVTEKFVFKDGDVLRYRKVEGGVRVYVTEEETMFFPINNIVYVRVTHKDNTELKEGVDEEC